jgi:hypothetical protein
MTEKRAKYAHYCDKILKHSDLIQLSNNIWIIQGTLPQPGPKFPRTMTIYRQHNSEDLILHSVICVSDDVLAKIECLGKITYIIVPNKFHCMDAAAYLDRFPHAQVLCPESCIDAVSMHVTVSQYCERVFPNLCDNESISSTFVGLRWGKPNGAGDECGELIFTADSENGTKALICTDLMFNLDKYKSDGVSKFLGSADGFGVTAIGYISAENPRALYNWLNDNICYNAAKWRLNIIIVGHGDVIQGEDAVLQSLEFAMRRLKNQL